MTDRPQWLYMNAGQALAQWCWSGIAQDQLPAAEVDAALREAVAQMAARLFARLEEAWGIIANAGGGDWKRECGSWQEAAARWRDDCWHATLEEANRTEPEEQPAEQRGPTITELLSGQWEGKEVPPAREITSPRGPILELTGSVGHEMGQRCWMLRDRDGEIICWITQEGRVIGDIERALEYAAETSYAPFWRALRQLDRNSHNSRAMVRAVLDVMGVLSKQLQEQLDA